MRNNLKGLMPLCKQLSTDKALKGKGDFWEPLIKLKDGQSVEEIVQEYEEYKKKI